MENSSGFVNGGCVHAEMAILDEVAAKYAEALQQAGFWQRRRIRRKIYEEVERRIEKEAPPDALY